jgi:hypothetical protein
MNCEEINHLEYLKLANLVTEKLSEGLIELSEVYVGPLNTNYFSFVFFIDFTINNEKKKVFVKIPKEDLRVREKTISPITDGDRMMARAEADSLRKLEKEWKDDDLRVTWVKLYGEIPEYNALITEAASGMEALDVFRIWDIRRRYGYRADHEKLISAMGRLGAAFGRFHKISAKPVNFHTDKLIPKLIRYCREIENHPLGTRLQSVINQINKQAGKEIRAVEVPTLKGIDIRNILIDEEDKLFVLDPGRVKLACREADLSRFLMTYRILYWGSLKFVLGLIPDLTAENAFLNNYYKNSSAPSDKLLHLFFVKEQLKHWHTALESLEMRSYPAMLKRLIAGIYVNPYYIRQLSTELKQIK